MRIEKISGFVAGLMIMMITWSSFAEGKMKYRLPSAEEQRLMREEVYFPKAKVDTSSRLLEEFKILIDEQRTSIADVNARQKGLVVAFLDNTFAELPISKMTHKVDFDSRLAGLKLISELKIVKSDTNILYSIAGFIGRGVLLSTKNKDEDLKKIQEVRKHLCFQPEQIEAWETQPKRYGCIHGALNVSGFEELIQACWNEYRAREEYNKKLRKFRLSTLTLFRKFLFDGRVSFGEDEREKIWEEFCRRAKASDEEKSAAEKAVPAIVEPKKEPEPPEDIKVDVEF